MLLSLIVICEVVIKCNDVMKLFIELMFQSFATVLFVFC